MTMTTTEEKCCTTAKAHTTRWPGRRVPAALMAAWTFTLSVPGMPGNGHQSGAAVRCWLVSLFSWVRWVFAARKK